MIWAVLAMLGMFAGFAVHQLVKNYLAKQLVRKASPIHLGFAIDKLTHCCSAYLKLIDDANRLFGVQTTPTMFAINSHLIYSVSCLRSIIMSLSVVYLLPGHAEYQLAVLKHWVSEIYPQHKIVTDYTRDASQVPELKKNGAEDLVNRWGALAAAVSAELQVICEFITGGLQGGKC